ncbi:MAG: hypothetical protein R3304_09065 [Longimicrobiales bacterium]|nr:hypothetical protein [Longimicrobiales bacterium]
MSSLPPAFAAWLPAVAAACLGLLSFTARVQTSEALALSFRLAAGLLLLWNLGMSVLGRPRPEVRTILRPHHYVQALCQVAVFAYWGWYWRPVYDMVLLIAGQLLFAYGFSMLLAWSRARVYDLGFGPFPIIFSINLFLWFRDDWFYLQFLMIVVGFLGKELIRWHREGRRVHVFNPSAFALGLFSLVLIATGSTGLTWGQEIASTLSLAPRIYLFLFLVGLVVMYFFSITLIAASAAAVLFGLSALYSTWAGVPYFIDSEIPAAVFLGLHLLITDPSTSPRTPLGKTLFGVLYGLGVFALYAILGAVGAPTFYDKLLCVPLLNLSVRGIDRLVRTFDGRGLRVPGIGGDAALALRRAWWSPTRLELAHIVVWVAFFGAMAGTGRTDGRHPGDSVPFWQVACDEGRRNACDRLLQIEASYCGDNSAWACNEVGIHYTEGTITATDADLGRLYFQRACELRFQAACFNLLDGDRLTRSDPKPLDLRLLLREGGLNLMDAPERDLLDRACEHEWSFACQRLAVAG